MADSKPKASKIGNPAEAGTAKAKGGPKAALRIPEVEPVVEKAITPAPAAIPAAVAAAPEALEASAAPAAIAAAEVGPSPVQAAEIEMTVTTETAIERTNEMTETINAAAERIQATQNEAADRFQAVIGDVNERTKTAVERGTKLVEELSDITKGNVEAFVASSKVAAQGVETLSREAADYGRRSFEEASAALKSFAEVRSPTDFFKLQGDYARSAFDSLVAESSKVSETVLKLAGDIAEPITSRYAVAAERVKSAAL